MASSTEAIHSQALLRLRRSPLDRFLQVFQHWPVFSIIVLGLLAFGAIFQPVVIPHDPYKTNLGLRLLPMLGMEGAMWSHPLGTDPLGKDMLAKLMAGARISLMVVAVSIITGKSLGLAIGLISGYYGGMLDEVLMRLLDIWYGIPFLVIFLLQHGGNGEFSGFGKSFP